MELDVIKACIADHKQKRELYERRMHEHFDCANAAKKRMQEEERIIYQLQDLPAKQDANNKEV